MKSKVLLQYYCFCTLVMTNGKLMITLCILSANAVNNYSQ